jgi:hypothetical protein
MRFVISIRGKMISPHNRWCGKPSEISPITSIGFAARFWWRRPPTPNPKGQVRFGSTVRAIDESGEVYEVSLVGEDEADVQKGLISYVSPLAKALLKARVGDEVIWQRPLGEVRLEILSVDGVVV